MKFPHRYAVWSAGLLGAGLAALAVWWLNNLFNNTWLVPLEHPRFAELQRAAALGLVEAADLMQVADWRLIAYFLLGVTVLGMGVSLPVLALIHRRRALGLGAADLPLDVVLRQALWAGAWLAVCAWLHLYRLLGLAIALLVLLFFLLLEGLILFRSRATDLVADNPAAAAPPETAA